MRRIKYLFVTFFLLTQVGQGGLWIENSSATLRDNTYSNGVSIEEGNILVSGSNESLSGNINGTGTWLTDIDSSPDIDYVDVGENLDLSTASSTINWGISFIQEGFICSCTITSNIEPIDSLHHFIINEQPVLTNPEPSTALLLSLGILLLGKRRRT